MNDSFLRFDNLNRLSPAADCQDKYPRSKGGFCGAQIHPDCLQISANGTVRVSLSTTAANWFSLLTRLGEVVHLARNPVAVLGCPGPVPVLTDWRNLVLPRDEAGLFSPNLAEYASLCAVRAPSPVGALLGLEARDVSGMIFERVLLADHSRRELFEQFVTAHQLPPGEAGNWFPPNHAWSARRCASLAGRIPWLRSRLVDDAKSIRVLPVEFLPALLTAAARFNFPIRTTHHSRALTQAAVWTPQIQEPEIEPENLPGFFHGNGIGLHLNLSAIAGVWLWTGKCACCDQELWSVEVASAGDQVGLTLLSGDEAHESDWRNLLRSCLP